MADNMLYRMDRKKMGIAVIINNLDEEQIPTKKDVEAMGSVLKVIGFDVKIHKNLSSEQMNSVKRDFTDPAVHRDSNCFLLCVISHGTEDNFLQDKHGAKTWNIESLLTEVSDISTLVGKPKLFFIEACRGKYCNVSQEMAKSSSSPYPLHSISLPRKQDLFVGFATVPGYVAFTASNGSPYIQALAEVLADHHHDLDLADIHFRVRRKMTKYVTQSGDRQGAEERTSLLSKLKFSEYKIASTALTDTFSSLAVSRPGGVPTYPETITLSGDGPGADEHPYYRGVYTQVEGPGRNGRPVWKNNMDTEVFLFYNTAASWMIGSNPQGTGGWIRSNKTHLTSIPTSGWQYCNNGWHDDPQIKCEDGVPTYPETITVSGAGPGADKQPTCMGVFRKEEGAGRNGRPVWRMVDSQVERFIFYNTAAYWLIGANPQKDVGWIQSNKTHLISIPTSGWQYGDGKDWQDDPQLVFV